MALDASPGLELCARVTEPPDSLESARPYIAEFTGNQNTKAIVFWEHGVPSRKPDPWQSTHDRASNACAREADRLPNY